MSALEGHDRNQKALLWAASGFDDYGRHKRSAAAVPLDVRWERRKSEMLDPQGNTIAVDATVVVDREIAVGSIMWEGSLTDLWALLPGTGTGSGTSYVPTSDIMEVVAYDQATDLKGRHTRRTVGLKRFRDTMPSTT